MELIEHLRFFSHLDGIALTILFAAWLGIGWLIEHPPKSRPSTAQLMAEYRRHWMAQMVTREPRIFDATILDTLRQGTAFFASACLIAIGGALAAISNPERFRGVAQDLTLDAPELIWEVKILLVLVFITSAFMKFIWSNRLFGYCAVMMASVPNDPSAPEVTVRTQKAAEINITAARAFNRGLRSVYFALGALGWLLGPEALLITTAITVLTLLRREFASSSRATLLAPDL